MYSEVAISKCFILTSPTNSYNIWNIKKWPLLIYDWIINTATEVKPPPCYSLDTSYIAERGKLLYLSAFAFTYIQITHFMIPLCLLAPHCTIAGLPCLGQNFSIPSRNWSSAWLVKHTTRTGTDIFCSLHISYLSVLSTVRPSLLILLIISLLFCTANRTFCP